MGQFLNSINEVRKNYNKYDAWEQAQADERARKEYLSKTLELPKDKVELTTNKAKAVIRATEIMDKHSEDNCEDMEQLTQTLSVPVLVVPTLAIPFGTQAYYEGVVNKINKEISTLKTTINNPQSTKEVIAEATSKLKFLQSKVTKINSRAGVIGQLLSIPAILMLGAGLTLWGTAKQKDASRIGRYQAKQNELKDVRNFVIYTPEQIERAKKIAEGIPDEKDRNSFVKMLSELKAISKDKKAYKQWLAQKDPKEIEKLKSMQYTAEQLKIGEEDKELIVDIVKEINIKAEEYSENVENAYDTLGTVSWLLAAPAGFAINKLLKALKAQSGANKIASFAVPIITSLGISVAGTVQQKKASRVGRYLARKDLMENPSRLMAYSNEDMEKAKNIKAEDKKQSFFAKLTDSFSFLAKYRKDNKAYEKYRKKEHSQMEKMQKALNQIEVTDAQRKDATKLQKNVFRAFDEVDEMSQRYSEDIEAGSDIAKQVMSNVWSLLSTGTMLGAGIAIYKGKFPISKIANSIANISFKKDSTIRKSINGIYTILKKDKKVMQDFQKSLVTGNMSYFLSKPTSKEVAGEIVKLISSFAPVMSDKAALSKLLNSELKDGVIAKWTRNMIVQSSNLYAKIKFGDKIPKEIMEKEGLNNWKNYKTLIGTGAVAGAPVLGLILGIPYAFNAWLTNIQKKAGKIGIMKAMDKIDDARVFAPTAEFQSSSEA